MDLGSWTIGGTVLLVFGCALVSLFVFWAWRAWRR